jgi:hypothetical protein
MGQPLELIFQIRNCIIHAYGDVAGSTDEKNLRNRAGKTPGYNLAGDQIWLEQQFPPYVVESVRKLFQAIFTLAGFEILDEDFIDDILFETKKSRSADGHVIQ